ncbi:MAG: YggS family pyridoxal phosphate-dependent enzyme, partial [Candidatus Aenigmatarchaeota archaeon]
MGIYENLESIKARIGDARLVVISKTVDVDKILEVQKLGFSCFGESYIQEAEWKIKEVNAVQKAEWHFVGHLQGNKAKKAVEMFDVIQSIDNEAIARKVDSYAKQIGKIQDVMIEVNLSEDAARYGVRPEATLSFAHDLSKKQNLKVIGIIAMAPFIEAEKTRPYFRQMKVIFDIVQKHRPTIKWLSMGMSNDYIQAIEEGA